MTATTEIVAIDDDRWLDLAIDADPHESRPYLAALAGELTRPLLFLVEDGSWRVSYVLVFTELSSGRRLARTPDYGGPWCAGAAATELTVARECIDAALRDYGVVSEVSMLSPWLDKRGTVAATWSAAPEKRICTSSLRDLDALARGLSKGRRSDLTRARRDLDVVVEAFSHDAAVAFAAEYQQTMAARGAADRWHLTTDHFLALADADGVAGLLLVTASGAEGRARALFLAERSRASYLYATRVGTAPGAATLALWTGMEALAARGIVDLTLGGGVTPAADDPLLRFKQSMATDEHDLYLAARVFDEHAHARAVAAGEARPLPAHCVPA